MNALNILYTIVYRNSRVVKAFLMLMAIVATSFKSYAGSITVTGANAASNGVSQGPISYGQTGLVLFGLKVAATGTYNPFTSADLTATANTNGYFTNGKLFRSTDNSYSADDTQIGSVVFNGTDVDVSGFSESFNNDTKYYFVVADYSVNTGAVPGNIQFKLIVQQTPSDINGGAGINVNGVNYSIIAPAITASGANAAANGISQGPLIYGQTDLALFGFSIAATTTYGPVTQINIVSTANTNGYFTNGKLYRSTNNVFSAATDVQVGTVTFNNTQVNVTGLSESFTNGQTKYYFLVADYSANTGTVPGNIQFKLTTAQSPKAVVGSVSYNPPSDILGTNYATAAPSIAAAGANAAANGISQGPLVYGQSGLALFGYSLTATGSYGPVTQMNIVATANTNGYFASGKLYRSTDNVFSAASDVQVGTVAFNSTQVNITGLSESFTNGQAKYYFLVADYSANTGTVPGNIQFKLTTAQNPKAVVGGTSYNPAADINGTNYATAAPSIAAAGANAAANGISQGPLVYGQSGLALFGFSLTATGNYGPVTQMNMLATANTNGYFASGKLYRSTDNVFSAASDVQVGTVAFNNTQVNVTGLSESFTNGQVKYYFLVADYSANTGTVPGNIQFKLTTAQNPKAIIGSVSYNPASDILGTNYSTAAPSIVAAGANAAANGISQGPLVYGQSGLALFGFSLTATGSYGPVTQMNMLATANTNGYFASGKLYRSTDNVFSAASDVQVGTVSFNNTQVNVTSLSESFTNGQVKYYFLVADYSVNTGTVPGNIQFKLTTAQNPKAVVGSVSYNPASDINGTIYTTALPTLTAISANAAANNVSQGPLYYGQTNIALFGFGLTASGTNTITTFNFTSSGQANNSYFGNGKLYASANDAYSANDTQVGSVTFNGTTVSVTGLTETITNGSTKYYFLVADYSVSWGTVPGTIQFKFTSGQNPAAISQSNPVRTTNNISINGVNYSTASSSIAVTSANAMANGITQGNVYAGQANIVLFGYGVTSTGPVTINEFHIQSTVSGYFGNGKLYKSSDNVYSVGDVAVGAVAFSGTDVNVTGLTESFDSSTSYYFLVGDFTNAAAAVPTTAQFKFVSGQSQPAIVQTSPYKAFNTYNISGAVFTLPAPSISIVGANAAANGVSQDPLYYGQSNIPLFGFALTATGPVTINEFHLQSTAANYFGNGKLYRSTDNVYSVATDVQVGTVTFSGTDVNVTGLTESFNEPSGKTYHYFLVADFSNSNGTIPGTVQFKFVSGQTTPAIVQSSPYKTFNTYTVSGVNYSIPSPVSMISANAAANGITQGSISYGQNNIVLFGFGLNVYGTYHVKEFHITNPGNTNNGYFGNGRLYRSTDAVYSGDDALISATVQFSGDEVVISNIDESYNNINGTTYYYFLKADYSSSFGTVPGTIQFKFVSAQTQPAVVQTTPYSYKAYNNFDITGSSFSIATNNTVTMTSANATANGISASPLSYGQTNLVLFGFGTTVTGTVAFTEFHITNPGNSNNNGYFANGRLYRSTDNVYSGNDVQVGTVSFSGAEVAITGMNEQFSNAVNSTLYYFLVADYTQSWGSASTPIQFKFVSAQSPAAIIQNNGVYATFNTFDIAGTAFSFSRISVWKGGTDSNWNNPLNWSGNFVPGANDVAQIGTESFTNQPVVSGNYNVSSITFGTAQAVTLTVNSGFALTVSGDVVQKRSSNSNVANVITGAGSLIASSLLIGDGTTALTTQTTKITSTIANLTLNANIGIRSATNNNATLDVQSGTVTIKQSLLTTNAVAGNNSTLNCAAAVTLNMTGAAPFSLATIGTNTINLPGVVDYNGTTAQVVRAGTYSTLKINNATGVILSSPVTVSKLVLGDSQASTVFDENGAGLTISVGGHIEMYNDAKMTWRSANFTLRSDDVINTCTTLEFNSSSVQNIGLISAKNYQNIIFNGSGTKNITTATIIPFTIDCSYTVNTPVTYASNVSSIVIKKNFLGSADINSGTKTINIVGDWLNTYVSTINALVSYDGANAQYVGGVNYSNVEFKNGNTKTVNANATVTGNLKVWNNTTLNANDKLTMISSATKESSINKLETGADIIGNVTVQSYITSTRNWRTMSSPINDLAITSGNKTFAQLKSSMFITGAGGTANGFDAGGTSAPYAVTIQKYNEPATASQSAYIAIANINETVAPGKAFYFFFRGDRTHNAYNKLNAPYATPESVTAEYKGPINKGTITVPLSYTNNAGDSYNGFNLVGNPYPSAIDWNALTRVNLPNKFYIIKPDGSSCTYSNGISANSGGANIRYISPGQAFYVQATVAGASIAFSEDSKATISAQARFLSAPGTELITQSKKLMTGGSNSILGEAGLPGQIKINLQNSLNTDETIIVMQNGYSLAADDADAIYYAGSTVSLSSIASDNKNMAINFLPDVSQVNEVKLNVNATSTGQVTLNFTDLSAAGSYQVLLNDAYLNKIVDVKANPAYIFTIDKGNAATYGINRFKLSFIPPQTLPVKLTAFTAKKAGAGAQINWTTASEQNNDHFTIERSADGKVFVEVATIAGANNSSAALNYSFLDKSPLNGVNYYRLKQVDKDGKSTNSDIVALNFSLSDGGNDLALTVYPNPATEEIHINLKNQNYSVILNVFDIQGRKVKTSSLLSAENAFQNVSDLNKGMYIVEVQNAETKSVIGKAKFLKD